MTTGDGPHRMIPVLRIGISARFFHRAPVESGLNDKRLLYLEESMAHWLLFRGALPVLISSFGDASGAAGAYAEALDGLVLQGGIDISPQAYGQTPLREEWRGDPVRDRYELELLHAFAARRKPVLGICRGLQLINVAYGGTLFQDIPEQVPDSLPHRDIGLFDRLRHDVLLEPESRLTSLYAGQTRGRINSIHHQAVNRLGDGMAVEARSPDGVVEAIRGEGPGHIFAVQWHPEFHPPGEPGLLAGDPILTDFVEAARRQLREGPERPGKGDG